MRDVIPGSKENTVEGILGGYNPDPEARTRRITEQIRELYSMGCDGERHQPVLSSCEGQLSKLFMYITLKCPNKCPFCCVSAGEASSEELPAERLAAIVQEASFAGMKYISITGGEPLVYGEFDRFLKLLAALDRGSSLIILRSSLSFPVPTEKLDEISAVFDGVITSIDGDRKTHDALRGPGRYENTVRNMKHIVSTGSCYTGINSVMEYDDFTGPNGEYVKKLADELEVNFLSIGSPKPLGRAAGRVPKQYLWRRNDLPGEIQPRFSCALGHNLYMQPSGLLYPCYAWCEPEHELGDLSSETLSDVMKNGKLVALLNSGVDTNEKCRGCNLRYLCGGKCKAFVQDRHNIDSGDFDCSENQEKILSMLASLGIEIT